MKISTINQPDNPFARIFRRAIVAQMFSFLTNFESQQKRLYYYSILKYPTSDDCYNHTSFIIRTVLFATRYGEDDFFRKTFSEFHLGHFPKDFFRKKIVNFTSRDFFRKGMIRSGLFPKMHYDRYTHCLLYTSPSPRDGLLTRMPSSA